MIEHTWSVLCTRAITDRDSRNISIIEVLEQINIPAQLQFPTVAPIQSDFVSSWYRSNPNQAERGTCRVTVTSPTGHSIEAAQQSLDLTVYHRIRSIVRSAGIHIDAPGVYYFAVDLRQDGEQEWRSVARIPLHVVTSEQLAAIPVEAAR
jgi:hypothetical protein